MNRNPPVGVMWTTPVGQDEVMREYLESISEGTGRSRPSLGSSKSVGYGTDDGTA